MSHQLYITKVSNGAAIPIFSKKGIDSRMPGIVRDIHIDVQPSKPRFFVTRLYTYIIHCIMTNTVVWNLHPLHISAFQPIRYLARMFETPVFTFRFDKLVPEEISRLKGYGLQQDLTNPNVFVGAPESHLLREITSMRPVGDRLRPGHVTYDGFLAWTFLMKGIMMYTSVRNSMVDKGYNIFSHTADEVDAQTAGTITSIDGKPFAFQNDSDGTVSRASDIFVVAPTDTPISLSGSFHDVGNLPTFGSGIFFPYFSGMNLSDKDTAFDFFSRIFSQSVATTPEMCQKIMLKIRSGSRQLAFHDTGIVMAHIYKVLAIAEQIPSAKIHIITKGSKYAGTVIEGDFSVRMHDTIVTSGDMSKELGDINLLESQARELCAMINSAEDPVGTVAPYSFHYTDFLTSRSTLSIFNGLSLELFASTDMVTKMRAKIYAMEFNDLFPVPDTKNVLACVGFMLTGDRSVLKDYPAFLGGGVLSNSGRVWEALSMYGPKVPSFNTGMDGGLKITIPDVGNSDSNIVRVDGNRPLAYFPFWSVSLQTGANQWEKAISTGIFGFPRARKGKKEFTNLHSVQFTVVADPSFTTLYDSLKTMVNEARAAGRASGKRKRGGGDSAAEPRKKKREMGGEEAFF